MRVAPVLALITALAAAGNPPVVIVPGFTSSTIEYKMENARIINPKCHHHTIFDSWQQLWPITLFEISSAAQLECAIDHLSFGFNSTTQEFSPRPGVQTRIPYFGSFKSFGLNRFSPLVGNMTARGWVLNETLFAAPFDWRQLGSLQTDFHANLKALVEYIYGQTGQKVSLLAISEGPQVTLAFLHAMTVEWKLKYINWFVANSPVWSGSPTSPLIITSGLNLTANMPFYLGRRLTMGVPGSLWLFPRPGTNETITFTKNDVLISTPSKNYTAFDYTELLTDQGLANMTAEVAYIMADPVLEGFAHPVVNTFVTYGTQIPTIESATYAQDFDPSLACQPEPVHVTQVSGDGIVTVRSSLRSQAWANGMAQAGLKLLQKEYPGQPHAYCMFEDRTCFDDVMNVLLNNRL